MHDKHLAKSIFSVLQQHMSDVEAIPLEHDVVSLLAGTHQGGDGLSGEALYLFPDRSYIYAMYSDIRPPIKIWDTGKWTYQSSLIQIHSDGTRPLGLKPDPSYLPFMGTCPAHIRDHYSRLGFQPPSEKIVWLVGSDRGFSVLKERFFPDYAEKKGKVSDIRIALMPKTFPISPEEGPKLKQRLLTKTK